MSSKLEAQLTAALNVGSSKAILEQKNDNPLFQLLEDIMNQVRDEITANAFKYDVNASMEMMNGIKVNDAYLDGNSVTVELYAEPEAFYWKYIDQGVNGAVVNRGAPNWGKAPVGTKTFEQAIDKWIVDRGIVPESGTSPQDYKNLNNTIRYFIHQLGKEPRPFVSDVLNENIVTLFREPIERLVGRAIQINIETPWQ